MDADRSAADFLASAQMRLVLFFIAAVMLFGGQSSDLTAPVIAALRSGNYTEAAQQAEAALKQTPQDPRLWTLDGLARARSGDSQGGEASYKHALQLAPDYLPALEGAAEVEYKLNADGALPLLKKIVALHPEDKTSHAMLGAIAFTKGDCKSAVTNFEASEPLIDSQLSALEEYGACLIKLDRAKNALAVFRRANELRPQDLKTKYNLALVESLAGNYGEVIETLSPLARVENPDVDVLELLAEAYEATGDTPKAVEILRQAIIANPDVPRFYLEFANISLVHASYRVGIDMLNVGLGRLPRNASLFLARGILYIQLGQYDKSDDDFLHAEQFDPRVAAASAARGMAALQENKPGEAEVTIRTQIVKQPDNAFLRYLLAEAILRKGAAVGSPLFKEALGAAEKAVELQPNLALARDVLGRLYLQEGNNREAIEQSRLAFHYDPTDQTALYHLILALKKDGQAAQLPELTKKLTELRERAREKESSEHKYALIEQNAASP